MGKASELDDWLDRHPLTPEERAVHRPSLPKLRLREDVPSVELDEDIRTQVTGELRGEDIGGLALRDRDGDIAAMVISVERYLELVGAQFHTDESKQQVFLDGRVGPSNESLEAAHVEQVDPHATWVQTDYDPARPPEIS